jgi:hypothetical protein
MLYRLTLLAVAATLAACANTPTGPGGKYLVYRDSSGTPTRQFDYPTDDFCKRVAGIAGRGVSCQADSLASQMPAHAALRYNPPGVLVQGHYHTMERCRDDTAKPGPGVEIVAACSTAK